jgi:hypothetical protein
MTALSQDVQRLGFAIVQPVATIKAATNQVFKAGSIVGINTSDGYAYVATTSTTLKVIGVAAYSLDTTGIASGVKDIVVQPGTLGYFSSGTSSDLIGEDDRGQDCYVIDDDTVGLTNGTNTRSRAGVIYDVTSEGVVVQFEVFR